VSGLHHDGQHDESSDEPSNDHRPCDQNGPGDQKCGCESHSIQANRVAADALPSVSVFQGFLLLTQAIPSGAIEFEHRYRPDGFAFAGTVRAQSLYARHCQLLI
jgi:hypothetical protein